MPQPNELEEVEQRLAESETRLQQAEAQGDKEAVVRELARQFFLRTTVGMDTSPVLDRAQRVSLSPSDDAPKPK